MIFPIVPLHNDDMFGFDVLKALYPAWDHPWPPRIKRKKK